MTPPTDSYDNASESKYEECNQDITANRDISFSVAGVNLPTSSGPYGPFAVVTRNLPYGQIVDINKVFGSVYVTDQVTSTGSMRIVSDSDAPIYDTASILFSFNIDVDLWKFDTFVLYVDSKWGVASSPVCTSEEVDQGTVNYFKSTDGTHTLDCVSHASDPESPSDEFIYIYGMSEDIDTSELGGTNSSLDIKLKITGFTTPIADWVGSNYEWKFEIWRWGTRNALRVYEGTGPETTPSTMTVDNWEPHGDYSKTELVQEMTLYTDITFTTAHLIPSGGTVELEFSDVLIHSTAWKMTPKTNTTVAAGYCYVKWFDIPYTCATSSDEKITITFQESVVAETQIIVTALSKFDGNTPTVKVTSYYSDTISPIDVSDNYSISYTSLDIRVPNLFKLWFGDLDGTATSDTSISENAIYVATELSVQAFAAGVTGQLAVTIPTNTVGAAESSVYISSASGTTGGPFGVRYEIRSDNYDSTDVSGQAHGTATSDVNTILSPSAIPINGSKGGVFLFYNYDTTEQVTYRPMVASNLETRYETWMTFTLGSGDKYVAFQVLTFNKLEFGAATAFGRLCGNAVEITIQPAFDVTTTDSETKKYYLDLTFPSFDINSGLPTGSSYPFATGSASEFASPTLTLVENGTVLRIGSQGAYNLTGTTYNYIMYTAIASSTTTVAVTATLYYIDSANDPNIKYIINEEGLTIPVTLSHTAIYYDGDQEHTVGTANSTITLSDNSNNTANGITHLVQLPRGNIIGTGASFAFSDGTNHYTLPNLRRISVDDPRFKYPAIIGTIDGSISGSITGTDKFRLTGITASAYVMESSSNAITACAGDFSNCGDISYFSSADACTKTANNDGSAPANVYITTPGAISVTSYAPLTTVGRGPDSYNETLTVTFSMASKLYEGTVITLQVDANWKVKGACTTTGLTAVTAITCTETDTEGIFEVAGFAELPSGTAISVSFDQVLPPINNSGANITRGHIDALYASMRYDGKDYLIDQLSPISNISCTVSPATAPGVSTIVTSRTIPPNALQEKVDLYLRFSITNALPIGSIIEVTNPTGAWETPTELTKDYVFMSIGYTSAIIDGGVLRIVTNEEVTGSDIELRVDRAFTNPAITTAGYFKIKTMYYNVVFDIDTFSNVTESHQLTVEPAVEGVINNNGNSIATSVTNADELADYDFNFSINMEVVEGDSIWIKFPVDFDPYLWSGSTKFDWSGSNSYYMECSSSQLGESIECLVDHWYLKVINIDEVRKDTNITLSVKNIRNPKEGTTGTFDLFLLDSNESAKAARRNAPGITLSALAKNIFIKRINVSSDELFDNSDYSFEFYSVGMVSSDHALKVKLPRQYNTNLTRGDESIACSLHKTDHSIGSLDESETDVIESGSCLAGDNYITLDIPEGTSMDLTNDVKVAYKVKNLYNPQWGITRKSTSGYEWDFDANDSDVFTVYDVWSEQAEVIIENTTTSTYYSRSYLDVNAAYLGFANSYRGFTVNDYVPKSTNGRITLTPGTQSTDIVIRAVSSGGSAIRCSAKSIRFTPSINASTPDDDTIRFTSKDNFTMKYSKFEIHFRVAAGINTPKGIYYIDWNIDEDRQDGLTTNQFDPPAKTLVEVASFSQISFTVPTLEPIDKGTKSKPITLLLTNPPHTSVFVDIEVGSHNDYVTVTPSSLEFNYDTDNRYFRIEVNDAYPMSTESNTVTLKFSLRGTDAASYNIVPTATFEITSAETQVAGSITQCAHSETTRTDVTLTSVADASGVIYYYVIPEGGLSLDGVQVKELVGDYFNILGLKEYADDPIDDTEPSNEDESNERLEPWVVLERRVYQEFLLRSWYGAVVCSAGTPVTLVTMDWLYAGTNYQSWCYVENSSEQMSLGVQDSWSTDELPDAVTFSIIFNGDISDNYMEELRTAAATSMGVTPYRLIDFNRSVTRRLQEAETTTFAWTLAPQLDINEPVPADEASLDPVQGELLLNAILELGITATPTFTASPISKANLVAPTWIVEPSLGETDVSSISATMQCSAAGEICGVCLRDSTIALNSNQILLGVGTDNYPVPSECMDYTDVSTLALLKVSGLESGTSYSCYYMCYASYPVWGIPMTYDADNYISFVRGTTTVVLDDDDDDWSCYLKAFMWVLVVLAF